ncbi:MAG: lysylphosphatidylglycerol synthase transmembrane domain-containing protein [Cyanobacteriota bacterium]
MTEQTQKEKKEKFKKRKLLIRILISVGLMAFFASQVDLKETFSLIIETNYFYLLLCLIIYLLGQSLSSYKWSIISKAIGFKNKFSEYIQFYYIGMFFNLFLPSTIGGDASKAYYLSKGDENNRIAPAIYTVLAERFSGLAVLAWLGTIAMLTPIGKDIPLTIKYIAILLSIAIILGAPLLPVVIKTFFSDKNWLNRSLMNDVMVFWNYKLVAKALGLSLIFHSMIIAIHILISFAMNLTVDPLYYLAIYPIVAIIGFIPIAFNGIGVREGAYIFFLTRVGEPESAGLAFGLLWFAIVVISSLIGGIVYVKGHHSPPPDDIDTSGINLDNITDNSFNSPIDKETIQNSEKFTSNIN